MKVLLVHNRYQQAGGEDSVFRAERDLLRAHGHGVVVHERDNAEIEGVGALGRAGIALGTVWSEPSRRALAAILARERPDVAHFVNTFPLISPSAYHACLAAGVPVVQSLQNYRLACPAASLLRAGRPCEECIAGSPWRGVRYGCYRGSRAQTAVVAAMLAFHRRLGTFRECVDAWVALHEFGRAKLVEAGLPRERVVVRPNFLAVDPGERESLGDAALFVGRLAPEKGVRTLLQAWSELPSPVPLRIVGDGPLRDEVQAAARTLPQVEFRGWMQREEALEAMRRARFLVLPSEWYEGLPMTAVEAFASGVPVLAAEIGGLPEVVDSGRTGLLFAPRDPHALSEAAARLWAAPDECARMGKEARLAFEERYAAGPAYASLMAIYARVGAGGAG